MAAELDLSTLDIPQLQSLHKQLDDVSLCARSRILLSELIPR